MGDPLYVEFPDFKDIETDKKCDHANGTQEILEEFLYQGSIIGPFMVYNALVFKYKNCNCIGYKRSEAQQWEAARAMQLLGEKTSFSQVEIKFLQQVLKTLASRVQWES